MSVGKRIPLPDAVARIYEAIAELEKRYPERKFTPDGHLVGSIGEVIAAEALALKLHPMNHPGHDAFDGVNHVQIKLTAGKRIGLYACCERLVVLRIISPKEAEIVYDGQGKSAWEAAGKKQKNGQRQISLHALNALRGGVTAGASPTL